MSQRLGMGERQLRAELDFLRQQGLVRSSRAGTVLTQEGTALLWDLNRYMHQLQGMAAIERRLVARFGLDRVVVVPGDVDRDAVVKIDLARAAATFLQDNLKEGDTIAVSGGTTMAEIARSLAPEGGYRNLMVVPARGGLGEDLELQANTIASLLARKLGGKYRLLHVPDNVGSDTINALSQEPLIQEVLNLIHSATVLLFSVGKAEEMARRRGLPAEEIVLLRQKKAVGEAFGYYFSEEGEVVHYTPSIGMSLEDLARVPLMITVAGGRSKAKAILAVLSYQGRGVLITDEGAARELMRLLPGKGGEKGKLSSE